MAINWSHLPRRVLNKVCLCDKQSPKYRRVYDKETGWHICNSCGKILAITSLLECDICKDVFVPKTYEEFKMSFLGAMCDACKP